MLILAGGLGRPAPGLGARGAAESTPSYRVFLPLVMRSPAVTAPPLEWLPRLNAYRAMAGLPPVVENPDWGMGARSKPATW